MFNPLLICVAILVLTCYGLFRRSRRRLYELAAKLPGPLDLPVIGCIHVGIGRGPTEIVDYMFQFRHKLPSMARAWVGPCLFVVVAEPEHIAKVLTSQSCVKKSYVYSFFGMEKGLFAAAPDHWRKLRKQLNPAFSISTFRSFVPTFNEKADKLVDSLESLVGRGKFDVFPKIGDFSLTTTVINTLGLDLDEATDDECKQQYIENADRLFTLQFTRIYKPWLHLDFIYKRTATYREEQKRIVKFQEMSRMVYEKRQKKQQERSGCDSTPDRDEHNIRQNNRFIDRLEEFAGNFLDEEGMIENLDTIISGGNETTACFVSAVLLMLGIHQEVQERVYEEVMDVVPAGDIDYEDIPKLVYLEMVIKETLRLLPGAPIIARINEADIQLGEYTIPANTQIRIPFLKVQRDKSIWGERSEEFDPENFSPENCTKRHPYSYLAFSGGIRNCIGMRYAYISMKIVLAKLLRNYKFSTDQKLADLKLIATIVVKVSGGYNLSMERRSNKPTCHSKSL